MGTFWKLLGPSWGRLGALLGLSWGPLGGLGASPGAILEAIDRKKGVDSFRVPPSEPSNEPRGALLGRSWALLGPSWGYIESLLGPSFLIVMIHPDGWSEGERAGSRHVQAHPPAIWAR